MRRDPYDLSSLRWATSDLLELKALKEAIPHTDMYTCDADVTMEDVPLEDDEALLPLAQERQLDGPVEVEMDFPEIEDAVGEPIHGGETSKISQNPQASQLSQGQEKSIESAPCVPQNCDHERSFSALSPTQLGARMAIASSADGNDLFGHASEIRLPLPAPWHHNLPYLLSTYLQLFFNTLTLAVIVWLCMRLYRDVNIKVNERAAGIIQDADWASYNFLRNKCRTGAMAPHIAEKCEEWATTMDRDPYSVPWLRAQASTLAEIFNDFVEPLSLRSMLALLVGAVGIFAVNYWFGIVRARTLYPIEHPPLRPHHELLFKKHI